MRFEKATIQGRMMALVDYAEPRARLAGRSPVALSCENVLMFIIAQRQMFCYTYFAVSTL